MTHGIMNLKKKSRTGPFISAESNGCPIRKLLIICTVLLYLFIYLKKTMTLIIAIKWRKFKRRSIKLDSEINNQQMTKHTSLYYISFMSNVPWLRR